MSGIPLTLLKRKGLILRNYLFKKAQKRFKEIIYLKKCEKDVFKKEERKEFILF